MHPSTTRPRLRRAATLAVAAALACGGTSVIGGPGGSAASASAPLTADLTSLADLVVPDVGDDLDLGSILDQVTQVLRQPDGFRFRASLTDITVGGLFETADGYSVDRDARGCGATSPG